MAVPNKVIKLLDSAKIKYEPVRHRIVYTAFDKAATLKLPQKTVGKTLVLKTDGGLSLALIPANRNLDKNKFKKAAGSKKVDFATERLIKNKFKGVKLGAIPPMGNLWKMKTYVDKSLLKASKILVNSGDYRWSIKISGTSLKKIVPEAVIGNFGKKK